MAITVPTDAYITLSDLSSQKLPHFTFDTNSKPTDTQAEATIKAVAADTRSLS